MHRNRQPPVWLAVGKPYQLNAQKGDKQRCQHIIGRILVRGDTEIRALFLSRERQVNFLVAGDFLHLLILQNLEPGSQAKNGIPLYLFRFGKEAVRTLRGVGCGEPVKNPVNRLQALVD